MLEITKRLTEAFGVSGFEDEIRSVIREEIAGLVDEIHVDALGNLVTVRRGSGGEGSKKVMFAAHMDQIGLMVSFVDEDGYLRFAPVGGIRPLACVGAQVRFADGTAGTVALDERANRGKEVPRLQDMYIDVGATGRTDAGPKVGQVAGFHQSFAAQGNAWFAPNMDDRIGCVVLVQLLRELKGKAIAHDVYAVFTSQEEVGTRGATTSAYAVDPDVAIALDVTGTGDTPHATPMGVYMGRGAAIKVQDGGMIGHNGLNRLLVAAAEAVAAPYQMEVLLGGTTDARSMQVARSGVPASAVSIPSRHIHTPSQIVDRRDVEAAVAILVSFLGRTIEL